MSVWRGVAFRRAGPLAAAALLAVALLLWAGASRDEAPPPPPAPPVGPSPPPPSDSDGPAGKNPSVLASKEPSPETLADVARMLGGHVVQCADPGLAGEAGQTGALSGQMRPPVPEAWPGELFATLDPRGLSLVVPNASGAGELEVPGIGTLEVSWTVKPDAPARCVGTAWISRALGIFGLVRDARGRPIQGALVSGCGTTGVTDAAGEFFLDASPAEPCALVASVSRDGVSARSAPRPISPHAWKDITDLVLVIEDLPSVPAKAAPDPRAEATAQSIHELCASIEQIRDTSGAGSAQVMAMIQPKLDACEQARQLLESGADPLAAMDLIFQATGADELVGARPPEE